LELAADWLVMAAWLTWLKSRLLLPADADDAADAELGADILASRLQDLQAVRMAAAWLMARPQLGHDVFQRGSPERLTEHDRSRLAADLPGLLRGYLAALRRAGAQRRYRPQRLALWTVQDAITRLEAMLGNRPVWINLSHFLPSQAKAPLERRAALASTLLAGLELARNGRADIRQDRQFGPILLRTGA
jgi:segregation and condensation protein A